MATSSCSAFVSTNQVGKTTNLFMADNKGFFNFDNFFKLIQEEKETPQPESNKDVKESFSKKDQERDAWIGSFFNNFNPIHGHGSGESDLEEIKRTQKEILQDRKKHFGEKDALKKKYENPNLDHHDEITVHEHDPALLNQKEDDAMYFDEDSIQVDFGLDKAADSLIEKMNEWIDKQAKGSDNENLSP